VRRLVTVVSIMVLGLASCASPRNALNTSSGSCFRALPAAQAAVGRKGSLVGVRKVTKDEIAPKIPQAASIGPRTLCAIAFRAMYQPGDVAGADPAGPGGFALVLFDAEHSTVVGFFVLDTLPVRFHHRG